MRALGVPDTATAVFCGNAHAASRVWRVAAGDDVSYVKCASSLHKLRAERNALRDFAPYLRVSTPTVLQSSEAERGFRMTEVAGSLQMHAEPRADVFAAAGAALRRLHAAPLACGDTLPLDDAFEARFEAWYERGAARLPDDLAKRVRAAWSRRGVVEHTRVACHRDYSARNWIWGSAGLGVIDFEHARFDHPFVDLMRLWETDRLASAPSRAFVKAWDPSFAVGDPEFRAVALLHTLCTTVWATEQADATYAAVGLQALRELT